MCQALSKQLGKDVHFSCLEDPSLAWSCPIIEVSDLNAAFSKKSSWVTQSPLIAPPCVEYEEHKLLPGTFLCVSFSSLFVTPRLP